MASIAGKDWKEFECSSGVTVLYGPFPYGMYWDIMSRALDEYPDPETPQKTIEVLGGTEEVDDLEDPVYQAGLKAARLARANLLGEATLEFCVEPKGGMAQWEPLLKRLSDKYVSDPPPEDETERRAWFLAKYALRTEADWGIVGLVQRFSQIDNEEVRRKAEQFPGDVAGPEGDGADAPGPVEE